MLSDDVEKRSPYQCDECGKRFTHPSSVVKHKNIHLRKPLVLVKFNYYFGSYAILLLYNTLARTNVSSYKPIEI